MIALDRYIFRQLFVATVFVTLGLVSTTWLTQSLRYIELIVNRGLTISGFLYLTALLIPSFLIIILPLALASAVLFTYNKLTMDSELIVIRAAGRSPIGLAVPALVLAFVVSLQCYGLTLYLVPTSIREFKNLENEIRNDYSGLLLRDGVFNELGPNLTVYVRDRGGSGRLFGIFAHDTRIKDRPVTVMAEQATLVTSVDGPKVILVNGNRQEVDRATGKLSLLFFDRYSLDISKETLRKEDHWRQPQERYLDELFFPNLNDKNDQFYARGLRAEGHGRLVSPLYPILFTIISVAALFSGEFNRRGQTRRILAAVVAIAVSQAAQIGLLNIAHKQAFFIVAMYIYPLSATMAALLLMVRPPMRHWQRTLKLARQKFFGVVTGANVH